MLVGVYIDGTSMEISGDTQAAMWTSELWAKGVKELSFVYYYMCQRFAYKA